MQALSSGVLPRPGVRVWTPGSTPACGYHSGTSFATPFVAAAVAAGLADGAQPDRTPDLA
jgi:hypothetical protein